MGIHKSSVCGVCESLALFFALHSSELYQRDSGELNGEHFKAPERW